MNEFIAQFILESRDLVEQATTGLAALEQAQHDEQWIDATFRAIHTLKGGAAIVEFAAMERLVHAAEDALSEVRAGKRHLDSATVKACLASLDQVLRWLDRMEQSGEVPQDAEQQATALLARLKPAARDEHSNERATGWVDALLQRNAQFRSDAKSAIRFTPRSASFFQGEDPLALFGSLPNLLALEIQPTASWPTLDALDPFESILVLSALTSASVADVRVQFERHLGECEIVALGSDAQARSRGALSDAAGAILKAQLDLLESTDTLAPSGRIASAGVLAANVLRCCGELGAADLVAAATTQAVDAKEPKLLRDAIAHALSEQDSDEAVDARSRTDAIPELHQDHRVRTLRIDAERIDALVRLAGELTVVKNSIGQATLGADGDRMSVLNLLRGQHAALDRLVSELQRAVLDIRVLPLRTVLQRFPRVVREMSESLNKQAILVIEGEDTEADKTILEMLFEPLLHIVRNAMDHGIESPVARARANKPDAATIHIRASRQGGQIHIEVTDDGAGIDLVRVRQKALDRELVDAARLDVMSDAELAELIFLPGFSTSAAITDISGRGVGMDVVRTTVERVGGRVSIDSRRGLGTSVKMTLPFSVMMTHVLTAEVSGQIFGIPLETVVETLSVPSDDIKRIGAATAIVRRDRTIPIYDLAQLLQLPSSKHEQSEALILVASVAGHLGGIRVERMGERMEVMLKPLDGLLASIPGITGTSILGDGRVLLVLDLAEVFQ